MSISKKIFVFFIVCPLGFLSGCDTAGTVESPAKNYFLKFYGDEGFQTGVDVAVDADGTFIIFGNSAKSADDGVQRLFLVKADRYGNVIWKKTFGDTLKGAVARDVEITSDHKIIIVANYNTAPGDRDILLMKRSIEDGSKLDSVLITSNGAAATPVGNDEDAISITEVSDGSFIVSGSTATGVNLTEGLHLRVRQDLGPYSATWKTIHSYGANNYLTKVFEINPDQFYGFGYNDKPSDLSKKDYNLWLLTLTGTGEGTDYYVAEPDTDERLGAAAFSAENNQFLLGGISTSKDKLFSKMYVAGFFNGVLAPSFQQFSFDLNSPGQYQAAIATSSTGGFFVLSTETSVGNSNLFLNKFTYQGLQDWKTPLVYGGAENDFSGSVKELSDGKILITGTMTQNGETKMVLIKVNKNGEFAD